MAMTMTTSIINNNLLRQDTPRTACHLGTTTPPPVQETQTTRPRKAATPILPHKGVETTLEPKLMVILRKPPAATLPIRVAATTRLIRAQERTLPRNPTAITLQVKAIILQDRDKETILKARPMGIKAAALQAPMDREGWRGGSKCLAATRQCPMGTVTIPPTKPIRRSVLP